MRPCWRVGSSAATSTCTTSPSGKTMRGPAAATVRVEAGGGGLFTPQARRRRTAASSSFLILHLDHILLLSFARDEVIFLRVVTERAERHAQQLGGLRLHAAGAL